MYVFGNESSNEAIVKSFILTGLPDSTSRIARFFFILSKNCAKTAVWPLVNLICFGISERSSLR